MRSLTRAHSRERPALVTTTFPRGSVTRASTAIRNKENPEIIVQFDLKVLYYSIVHKFEVRVFDF